MYASTRDPLLDSMMDKAIAVIAKAQRADGYVYTKAIIEQKQSGKNKIFDDELEFKLWQHVFHGGRICPPTLFADDCTTDIIKQFII